MFYKIIWDKKPREILQKLQPTISSRIYKKVNELTENPFSKIKRLKGDNVFSLRVGDYRVILDIDMKNKTIYILNMGHRKNIYERD